MKNNIKLPANRLEKTSFIVVSVILMLVLVSATAAAATLEATPNVTVRYSMNDNVYASDDDEEIGGVSDDPVTAGYVNYLLGLLLKYQEGRNTFSVEGNAGYEQWVSLSGIVDDAEDETPGKYDYARISLTGAYSYLSKNFTLDIRDTITRSRDLQEVFGEATDAVGYWSLYTHNLAQANVKFKVSPKTKILVGYNYDTLNFEDPENDVAKPADSIEHRGSLRTEYMMSGKTHLIADVQYATRDFEDTDEQDTVDYDLIQGMAGIRYIINSRMQVSALGGYAQRTYSNEPDTTEPVTGGLRYDLEDMGDPIGKITFMASQDNYQLTLNATQGISTYGQNLFFTYTSGGASFKYDFSPKLYTRLDGQYKQAFYDVEKNGREWEWDDDRTDLITYARALLHWDILQKGGEGTLSLEAGYTYYDLDSNIDDNDDYNPGYVALFPAGTELNSYDAVINTYYVQFQMLPTILFTD